MRNIINGFIPRTVIISSDIYESNRGDYVICPEFKINQFTIEELDIEWKKWKNTDRFFELVQEELDLFENSPEKLKEHPFWKGEEEYLLDGYINLYQTFFQKMAKSKYSTSRNTVAANADTCVSYLQRWEKTLYCVSRSCDISLGYLADLRTLYLIAKKYNLTEIKWVITTPHVYTNNLDGTHTQFMNKEKNRNLIFNKRQH